MFDRFKITRAIIRLAELIEDWDFLIQRDGWKPTLPVVASDIAKLPYRHMKFLLFARSLDEQMPDIQPKITLEIHPFEKADLELVRGINRPSEASLCSRLLAREHHGFMAMNHSRVAGYAWGCCHIDTQVGHLPLNLKEGDILCNDAFTAPAYRGKGVQTALTLERMKFFQQLGYRRALCYIEKQNSPSIAVWQKKLYSSLIGHIDFKRIGPWYHVEQSDSDHKSK